MDYQKIFKRAWEIVWNNKFLWLLGLLAGGGGWSGAQYSSSANPADWQKFKDFQNTTPTDSSQLVKASVKSVGQVLGESTSGWHPTVIFWLILGFILALILLFVYLGITARGGLIKSVAKTYEDEPISLKFAWSQGHKYFWRLLSLSVLLLAFVMIVVFGLVTPVALLAIFSFKIPAIILGVIFGLLFIVTMFYLSAIVPLAEQMIVIKRKRPLEAIFHAAEFFNKNWRELLVFYLILIALNIAAAMAIGFGALIILIIAGIIAFIFYLITKYLMIAYAIVAGIAFIALVLTVSGAVKAFLSASLTLAYLELAHKE